MTEPRPRVFISSVMEGYGPFREAAAEGTRQAGAEPVRAEDFPAAGHSPRNACLDGVASADALVLLLGDRYGFVGPSGKAVTEEEYEEARRTHKRVLVFLQEPATRESRQEAFASEVQSFVGGHWRKTFRSPEELTKLVREAVSAADLSAGPHLERRAGARIDAALNRRLPEAQGIVWLQAVWTTLRDEEVVDPLDLGDEAFKRRVLHLAHGSEPPLLSYEEGKQTDVTTSHLRIRQGDVGARRQDRDLAVIEIHADGTLAIAANVSGTEARSGRMEEGVFAMYFLAPSVVRDRLERAWAFASDWWTDRDPYRRHEPLLFNLALQDVGARHWGEPTRSSGGGITIPGESPQNPLVVFDRPRKVSRGDLRSPAAEIDRSLAILERRFQEWRSRW